ncbi:ribonuclease toxin immunity protein CdiI [Myroides sp. DF42-4-2]|uniref:ribonuclease toxin immunity protein CdiI n=1 Tax=Myroides sp. DF42-4-2 TaxID=2746726 RepID=UPI002574E077|nr:ribonuclease toxin immunity protein CdiI [Myroides sp. DF42-4-2]MDM1408406.1 hypothetical protein [Myroides sp. DF42-4-2]
MKKKLKLNDDNLFPVEAFFYTLPTAKFIDTLMGFSNKIGVGFEDTVITFPEELDDNEEKFEGVEFSVLNEEVVISNKDFLKYLYIACGLFVEDYPDKKDIVEELFRKISNNYN